MGLFSRALVDRHAVEWVFDGVEWLIDAYADAPLARKQLARHAERVDALRGRVPCAGASLP